MSITDFQLFDRVQFDIARLEDEMKRLLARVTALEAGSSLPPDQVIEAVALPDPLPATAQPQPQPAVVLEDVELGLGAGMTISPLARPATRRE